MESSVLSLFYRLWYHVCKAQVQGLIGTLKHFLLTSNFGTANLILIFAFFLEYLKNKVLYYFKCNPVEYLAIFECVASLQMRPRDSLKKWEIQTRLVMASAKLRYWRLSGCMLKFPGRKWLRCSTGRSHPLLPWVPDSLAYLFQLFQQISRERLPLFCL